MSFILDALKKSENARQRQVGPALFEVKVTPPRRAFPLWAIIIGVLLIINGGVLTWVLMRHTTARAARRGAPAERSTRAATTRSSSISATSVRTPGAATAPPEPTAAPSSRPILITAPTSKSAGTPASRAPPHARSAQASSPATAGPNPADFAPALAPSGAAHTGATGSLPVYAKIAAASGSDLPKLHLDLHVYASNPKKRFVMINMHKLRQGGSLPDGVTVVTIRPDGVVLSYQGRKFLMPR